MPTGLIRKEYWLPNIVLNADVLISVPVLKNHFIAGVTLGMKNLIGLLPNDLYHAPVNIYGKHSLSHSPIELDQHIVDLSLARRPDFVVADGQQLLPLLPRFRCQSLLLRQHRRRWGQHRHQKHKPQSLLPHRCTIASVSFRNGLAGCRTPFLFSLLQVSLGFCLAW